MVKKLLFLLLLIPFIVHGQYPQNYFNFFQGSKTQSFTPVWTIPQITYPLTPHQNGWIVSNGKSIARMSLQDWVFMTRTKTDSATFEIRFQLKTAGTQYLFGLWAGNNGYYFLDGGNYSNTLEFGLGNKYFDVRSRTLPPAGDSTWLKAFIRLDNINNRVQIYLQDTLRLDSTGVTSYASTNSGKLFTIGDQGTNNTQADPSSIGITAYVLKANNTIDYLYVHQYHNGVDSCAKWDFNEGAGQTAFDSLTFLMLDRASLASKSRHIGLGWNLEGPDENDFIWNPGPYKTGYINNVTLQGNGLWMWAGAGANWNIGSYTNGQCNWMGNIVYTGQLNRVNVPSAGHTDVGDSCNFIAKWNGTTLSRVGNLSPSLTGTIQLGTCHDTTLIAGGQITTKNIYILNPTENIWKAPNGGLNNLVFAIKQDPTTGNAVIGGAFTADSLAHSFPSHCVMYDGSTFTAIGSTNINTIWSLCYWGTTLYAGTTSGVYKLVAGDWVLVTPITAAVIYCMAVYNNEMWFGGSGLNAIYSTTSTGTVTNRGVTTGWSESAAGNDVIELKTNSKDIYALGMFWDITYNAKKVVVDDIARYNGKEWSAVVWGNGQRIEDGSFNITGDTLAVSGDTYSGNGLGANNVYLIKVNQ